MKANFQLRAMSLVVFFSVLTSVKAFQTDPMPKGLLLLEIVSTDCRGDCDRRTIRLYADGRYVSERNFVEVARSGHPRLVQIREEKQLEPDEVAEVVSWANDPDFLGADAEYVVKRVKDSPTYITITSYGKVGIKKEVTIENFNLGSEADRAKVPKAVMNLARWARPYFFSD